MQLTAAVYFGALEEGTDWLGPTSFQQYTQLGREGRVPPLLAKATAQPPAGLCRELNGLGVRNILPDTLIWPPPTQAVFPTTPPSPAPCAGLVNGPGR